MPFPVAKPQVAPFRYSLTVSPGRTLNIDMHPKKVTVKKVTGVKLVTLFILILAVTQHIH